MSKWPMRGQFRYLCFKTFPMTPRTPLCEVFWALLLSSKHSGVPEDSKSPTLEVLGFTLTLGQSGVATNWQFDSRPLKVGNQPLPNPPNSECEMSLERSRQGLQLWLRPRGDQTWQSGVMSSKSPTTPTETPSEQFLDSNLGVLGKRAIWM